MRRMCVSQVPGCSVSFPPQQSAPFTAPWYTATVILLMESFSHKSCHPPNKAIKRFVCIIEGKVLPWVSIKQWYVFVCAQFLKNSCSLGCIYFLFLTEVSISISDCSANKRSTGCVSLSVKVVEGYWIHGYIEHICWAACLWLCPGVAYMFQLGLWGSFTTLDKFITAHLVLFILTTHSAKLRLRIQAFSELHSSFHSLSPSASITAARLSSCFYVDNEYFSNYGVTLEMKLNSYCVLNNLV